MKMFYRWNLRNKAAEEKLAYVKSATWKNKHKKFRALESDMHNFKREKKRAHMTLVDVNYFFFFLFVEKCLESTILYK